MKRLSLGALLLLAACGDSPMEKAGVPQQEKDRDYHECLREAYGAGDLAGTPAFGYKRQPNQELYDACMTARGYKRK